MTDSTRRTSEQVISAQGPAGDQPTRKAGAASTRRRIGPAGTATRAVVGGGFLAWGLLVPHRHPWLDLPGSGSRTWGALVGFVVLPASITAVIWLRGRHAAPLRFGSEAACLVTGVLVLASFLAPIAILTFVGGTMLLLAVAGRGGCEVMAVPNLVLRRDDYLACLGIGQVDGWEQRRAHDRESRPTGRAG